MASKNQWVTYLDRGFSSIKNSIINRLKVVVPEVTDLSDSNILIVIVDLFAGLVEHLNYYIDNIAREMYISTARRYSSLTKLVKLIDYRVRARISAKVDLKITMVDSNGDPVILVSDYLIPAGTVVTTEGGMEFVIYKNLTIPANISYGVAFAKQQKLVTGTVLGAATGNANLSYKLSSEYEHDTLQITINSVSWELRDTFGFSGPLDKHFIVEVNELKEAWVVFGDGVNGLIPTVGESVVATYYNTKGLNGNVSANTIVEWDSTPTPPTQSPAISEILVTNPVSATGGLNEEDIERIRKHAPLSLRTLNRAVTRQDYKDIVELVPGVGKAETELDLVTKALNIFIAPEEGGTASGALITEVTNALSQKGLIGAQVNVYATGLSYIRISATVTAKFRRDVTDTYNDILEALIDRFGFNNSWVNRKIRKSDIVALIDNLDKVDYLDLNYLTIKPYPRTMAGANSLENNWYININTGSNKILQWRLIISSATEAILYRKESGQLETRDTVITYSNTDPTQTTHTSALSEISIGIFGTFSVGNTWMFHSYPYNEDLELADYTIPTILVDELSITVEPQIIAS